MRARLSATVFILALALAAGCGGGSSSSGSSESGGSTSNISGSVSVMGIWTGPEQAAFQKVIDGFNEQNPDVSVKYTSAGDELPTQLATAVAGGNPPSVAFVAQPGLIKDFVGKGALKPIDYAKSDVEQNLGQSAVDIGSVDGKLYGVLYKAANKSLVWYNVKAFNDAGVQPPKTWDEFIQNAGTLKASGVPAYSIGVDVGWPITDLFENIYLSQAGPDNYDKLSTHEIPWTDQTVKDALKTMAQVLGDGSNIYGGTSGALQTDFPTSVGNVFIDPPKAAQIMEGDFVPGSAKTTLQPGSGYNVFPFPQVGDTPNLVMGGGDIAIAFEDNPAVQAFMKYLTTTEAAEIWAKQGGFASLNKGLDPSVYPSDIEETTAGPLTKATAFRFDMSDLQPAAFGATVGQGEWKIFSDFVKDPSNVDGTAAALEKAAAKAYGNG
jgi:ABC-type glycerol-3-phosphate transport system substrate-binding protein